jgi:hypothetical protein
MWTMIGSTQLPQPLLLPLLLLSTSKRRQPSHWFSHYCQILSLQGLLLASAASNTCHTAAPIPTGCS